MLLSKHPTTFELLNKTFSQCVKKHDQTFQIKIIHGRKISENKKKWFYPIVIEQTDIYEELYSLSVNIYKTIDVSRQKNGLP